jgi:hypothetical protein
MSAAGESGRVIVEEHFAFLTSEPTCAAQIFCSAKLAIYAISLVANSCFDGLS